MAEDYVIEMLHITKEFPGIKANDDITLQLRKGEVHALLGENGAGKSTLMSVLFGLYQPEQGKILKNGKEVAIRNPNDANALGIGMVHQHFKLVECFTVLDNIILGVEDTKHGFLQKDEARKKVMALSEKYGLKVDPDALVSDISVGMQQRVEILKMLYRDNEILIFDEPTAVLTPQEIDELMEIMRGFKKEGKSILFITHKLNEIMAVADRCTVLRKGKYMGTVDIKGTTKEELSRRMVGRDVQLQVEKQPAHPGETMLDVENVTIHNDQRKKDSVKDVTFQVHGGEIVAAGSVADICKVKRSITGAYLSGRKFVEVPETRREGNGKALRVVKAHENNLQDITVDFPLGKLICVTGVSGSGKSTLVNEILYKTLAAALNGARSRPGQCEVVEGMEWVDKVIGIDQSPIGRTPRSNPATYTGVFNDIRTVFSQTQDAKMRGYGPGRFSFNVKGGRCEACEGNGILQIEMHFLPDVYVPCEVCKGARYNRETLEVKYKEKTIADVLNMTVEEAVVFFANQPKIARKLQTLLDVGLGYVTLGQSATTLSGGEAQRVKLANELARRGTGKTVYILDEPTTGLHIADVHRLIEVLQKLVDVGNTVIVIEHNLDLIKCADHIIDLGPEGGSAGGEIVAEGTPEQVAAVPGSFTGQYLRPLLERDRAQRAAEAEKR